MQDQQPPSLLQLPVVSRRLLLRPLGPPDADDLLSYHSLEQTHRYLPMAAFDRDTVATRLVSGPWAKSAVTSQGDALCLGVELGGTGRLIGDVMLMWHSEKLRHGEIGYVINPEHAGAGYATEAAHALLHLAFDQLGLHRVTARILPGNYSSRRLAERLGMRPEAHEVESTLVDAVWSDQLVYAILEREWREQTHRGGPGGCGAA